MKKFIFFIIVTLMFSTPISADDNISVYINDKILTFEQPPIIQNDSTLVPFRTIFESLDMTVQWFSEESRVTAANADTTITLIIDKPEIIVNDEIKQINTAPIIYNNFTFVPLRAVSEAIGAEIIWDSQTKTVIIKTQSSSFEDWGREVLELTNIERAKHDIAPLTWDDTLASLAKQHCQDMIKRDFFSHVNPDGKTPFDRIKDAGIKYWTAGENIAAGQPSPEKVVKEWMKSKTHKENILNVDVDKLGVAVVRGGTYGIYWAQEFARFQ